MALTLAVLLIYNYSTPQDEQMPDISVSKNQILDDFKSLEQKDFGQGVLGGSFYPTYAYFPHDFDGKDGDMFYICAEDGHIVVTHKYKIRVGDSAGAKVEYELIEKWEDYRPPEGRFETYSFDGTSWSEVKNNQP